MFVSCPSLNPSQGGRDRAHDLARAVDREIVVEDRAAGRLTHGLGDVFQFLHHFDSDQIAPRRCRLDVDQGKLAIRLQGGLEAIHRRLPSPNSTAR